MKFPTRDIALIYTYVQKNDFSTLIMCTGMEVGPVSSNIPYTYYYSCPRVPLNVNIRVFHFISFLPTKQF